jgi:aspartate/methionine/tyrosine aminotransferase
VLEPVIPRIGALQRQRVDVLSLAQGMVNWGPPAAALAAAQVALGGDPAAGLPFPWPGRPAVADRDRYGPMEGDPLLLEAIRCDLVDHHGLDLDGNALLATAGSNMAFHAIAQVILDPGDAVLLPIPWYFNHWMAVQLAGGEPVAVDAGWIPDPDRLEAAITPRTRAIVTISPANPSGVVIPPPLLDAINRLCERRGLFHISDEAYAAFVHGSVPHVSPGRLPGSGAHTVTLHSLSKAYGMAGWRLGHASVPRQLLSGLAQVQDTVLICPPRLLQPAAAAALAAGPAWCEPRIASLAPRRALLLEAVTAAAAAGLPVSLAAPLDGAFYGLLACTTGLDEHVLVERLILEHGVAVLPGGAFGLAVGGAGGGRRQVLLRLSYGMLDGPDLERALQRLFAGLEALAC